MTLSEVVERLTERRSSSPAVPTFEVEKSKLTAEQIKQGVTADYVWRAFVPVCEEFPTAAEAFAAATEYADTLRQRYTPEREPASPLAAPEAQPNRKGAA